MRGRGGVEGGVGRKREKACSEEGTEGGRKGGRDVGPTGLYRLR